MDGSDIPKKGNRSAGVARQYCGATGKVDNCQAGVFLAYSNSGGATLVDGDLYLPESWFTQEKKKLWKDCRIPESCAFWTKPQMALEMIGAIHARGQLPVKWILADEGFSRDSSFLDGIPKDYFYFCEVPSDTRIWLARPQTQEYIPRGGTAPRVRIKKGELQPKQVSQILDCPDLKWEIRTLKEGAKGPLVSRIARMRVVEVRNGLPGEDVWLFLRRNPETDEVKFFLSNAPENTSLDEMSEVSVARWPIETCFQEAKGQLGMDQYEVRSYTGWQHHMTLIMLAHHFLIQVRHRLKKNACSDPSSDCDIVTNRSPHMSTDEKGNAEADRMDPKA